MMSDDFLTSVGIHFRDLAMGLQGGISSIFLLRKPKPWNIWGSVIMGMFTANAFGSSVASFPWNPFSYDATVYGVGVAGGTICLGIIGFAKRWIKLMDMNKDPST
jgi:hypothetical protein